MNYKVKKDEETFEAQIAGPHTIWLHRAPRAKSVDAKPGIYVLTDSRGYCCYVGETDNLKQRMSEHESTNKYWWWTHTIYFWDENSDKAFSSTDDRHWYEKSMKESVESKHPTFTKNVHAKPEPAGGKEVLGEMLALLDVIDFDTAKKASSPGSPHPVASSRPTPTKKSSSKTSRAEPSPPKNHRPPLGPWPNHTTLAKAIAKKNGKPGTAGGILHKLTNFWEPGRGTSGAYSRANPETRKMLQAFGVEFDGDGFVKSCARVPFPLH